MKKIIQEVILAMICAILTHLVFELTQDLFASGQKTLLSLLYITCTVFYLLRLWNRLSPPQEFRRRAWLAIVVMALALTTVWLHVEPVCWLHPSCTG